MQIVRVHDVPETVQALRVWRGLRDQDAALTPRALKATTIGPSGSVDVAPSVGRIPQRADGAVEEKRVADLERVAEEARELAERDRSVADDEQWSAVGRDADPVADVARAAVSIERRVELAVDHQHRAGLGGEADVGRWPPLRRW